MPEAEVGKGSLWPVLSQIGALVTIGKHRGDQAKCTKWFRTVGTDTGKVW